MPVKQSILLFAVIMVGLIAVSSAIAHLSEAELRKGIAVAMAWKKLSFEQRKEMITNMLYQPNFDVKLQHQLINSITTSGMLDKRQRTELIKLILIKAKQEFHEG